MGFEGRRPQGKLMVTVMLVFSMIVGRKVDQVDQGFEVVIKREGGRTQRRR